MFTHRSYQSPSAESKNWADILDERKKKESAEKEKEELETLVDYYLKEEMKPYNTAYNPLSNHEIDTLDRTNAVDWIMEGCTICKFSDTSLFRSIKLMDHFLARSQKPVPPDSLNLLALSAFVLATKYEEICSFTPQVTSDQLDQKYSLFQILQYQLKILTQLKFRIGFPTLLDFICCFAQELHSPSASLLLQLAIYMGKMTLLEDGFSGVKTSMIAFGCIWAANRFYIGKQEPEKEQPSLISEVAFKGLVKKAGYDFDNISMISIPVLDTASDFDEANELQSILKRYEE